MFLVFVRGGPSKWYAETPSGEYAFGDTGGLYEWRNGKLITHSGGDRAVSGRNLSRDAVLRGMLEATNTTARAN